MFPNIGWSEWSLILIAMIVPVLMVVATWRIVARMGFNPLISLLILVPLVNLIVLFYIAEAKWPALERG